MPPEQVAGEAVNHLGDQYSFAVALREALWGGGADPGDAPAGIVEAIERGAHPFPGRRHRSMEAFLRALARAA